MNLIAESVPAAARLVAQTVHSRILQRCGSRQCPPGSCDHDGQPLPAARSLAPVMLSATEPYGGLPQRDNGEEAPGPFMETGHDFARIPVGSPPPQLRFEFTEPDDPSESEADRVAEEVMRPTERLDLWALSVGGGILHGDAVGVCPDGQCQEDEEAIYSKREGKPDPSIPPQTLGSFHDGGAPLPRTLRSFFESRFGKDFSAVRIHIDSRADRAARSIGALAYTLGHDVVFAGGRYQPGSTDGRRLLAHELTHVVQQGAVESNLRAKGTDRPMAHGVWNDPRVLIKCHGAGVLPLQRYSETTEPASRLSEFLKDILIAPVGRTLINVPCLQDLERPMKELTFDRWIAHACGRSATGYLHSREWDAFGHCWIGCEGTRRCGETPTALLGAGREISRELGFGGPHDSFRQDIFNQATGRRLAYAAGTCYGLCDSAHNSGRLDLTAPVRKCADCATSGSEGPCP